MRAIATFAAAILLLVASGPVPAFAASPAMERLKEPSDTLGIEKVRARLAHGVPDRRLDGRGRPNWAWEEASSAGADTGIRIVHIHCQLAEGDDTCWLPDVAAYVRETVEHQAAAQGRRITALRVDDATRYADEHGAACSRYRPGCDVITHYAVRMIFAFAAKEDG